MAERMAGRPDLWPTGGNKRGKTGKRPDLDNQFFRSRWEANWARYLNWLIERGELRSWEYEPETFEFHKIKRGSRFYTPDFKVTNNDGSIEFHEVKGYMDQKSRTKLDRMRRYYPEITVILIDKDVYADMASKMKRVLPGWEDGSS